MQYAFAPMDSALDVAREFDKLVRDEIPTVIRENGGEPTVHRVSGVEYSERLIEKLAEEVREYRDSRDAEELVDILEVVHAIRQDQGMTVDAFEERRAQKAAERGRFDDGVVLERVDE